MDVNDTYSVIFMPQQAARCLGGRVRFGSGSGGVVVTGATRGLRQESGEIVGRASYSATIPLSIVDWYTTRVA